MPAPAAITVLNDGAIALIGVTAVLCKNAIYLRVDFLIGDLDHWTVQFQALEVLELDRRQYFIFNFECQIGIAIKHIVDDGLILRQVNLGLGRGPFLALVKGAGHCRVDGVRHDFRHGGAAIDLL